MDCMSAVIWLNFLVFLHVCSFSPGSVLESLYNHFKEAIPIKPLAEFLQKIAVSIAFYFQFIDTNHRDGSGEGVQRVCHPSPLWWPVAFLYL